jgi:POT family proton-dependent oligopeptide transporter
MSLFVSNNLIGWIGGFYEKMTPIEFWAMHAVIAAAGGVLVLLVGRRLSRTLEGDADRPLRPSALTLEVER